MEQVLHVCIFELKNRESDRADTRANKLLFRVVEGGGRQEKRESLQSVVEEKVYCLIVEPEDHGLEEVHEVVRELFVLRKLELISDQV